MARSSIARSTGVSGVPSFPEQQTPDGVEPPKSASGERASGEKGGPARDAGDVFERPSGKGGTNPQLRLVKDPPEAPAGDPAAQPPADAKPADAKPADAKPADAKPAEEPKPRELTADEKVALEAREAIAEQRRQIALTATYEVKRDTLMRWHSRNSDFISTLGQLQRDHFRDLKKIREG